MIAMLLSLVAAVGCGHLLVAAHLVSRFAARPSAPRPEKLPAVTVLKPLHGAPPGLYESLASFCVGSRAAPRQIVCGVADGNDPAVEVVERLRAAFPDVAIDLVIDPTRHGANRKVSTLIATAPRIAHEVVVISDADITLRPHDLERVLTALDAPGVGAVTCLYGGIGASGVWSDLVALGITSHFLPNAIVGIELGRATPCFGSLIALRRETLDAIGGFAPLADTLADDYALGAAVRATGKSIAVPPLAVLHTCDETSLADAWKHELRWARTIAHLDFVGHAGSFVTHPLAFALAAVLLGGGTTALGLVIAAIVCRIVLVTRVARAFALPVPGLLLTPVRDLLGFALLIASLVGRDVVWRHERHTVDRDGTMTPGARAGGGETRRCGRS